MCINQGWVGHSIFRAAQLDIATKCGADVILNAAKVNVVEEVQKLTGGFGCDVYVEATGHPLSVKQG